MGKWSFENIFPKHKSDQIGLNKEKARFILSNPKDPAVCPLQALASYLLVNPQIFINAKKLVPSSDQKKRFNSCLYRVKHYNK